MRWMADKYALPPKIERKSSFCQPWHLGIELSNRLGSPLSCCNRSVEQLIINNLLSFSEVANSIWYIQVRHIFLKVFIFVRASRRGTVVACVCSSVRPSIHLVRTITSHRFALESPNWHETGVLWHSLSVLKMEVLGLDLQCHFGNFNSESEETTFNATFVYWPRPAKGCHTSERALVMSWPWHISSLKYSWGTLYRVLESGIWRPS